MADPTRDQLMGALRKADAAGDTEAARAIARRIASMDEAAGEGLDISNTPITDEKPYSFADGVRDVGQVIATSGAKAATAPIDLAMGVAGDVNQAVNYGLTQAGAGLLDLVGANETAQSLRQTSGRVRQDLERGSQSLQTNNALEQVLPTPKGYEAGALGAEIVASLGIPFKTAKIPGNVLAQPKAQTEAGRVIAEGAKRNVPVMTSDVRPPTSGMGRAARAMGENIPIAGTSGPRAAQQAARQDAVRQVVEEFGGDTTRAMFDDSDTIASQVTSALTKARKGKIANLKTAKDSVIESIEAPFNAAPRTVQAITEQVRKLQGVDAEAYAPVIARLQRFGEQLTSGKTLEQVEGQRRLLGELFQDPSLAAIKGDGQKAINAIYDPLRKDMGEFIEATAGAAARAKWSRANQELSALAGELDSAAFRNVLRQSDVTPDKIKNILFSTSADPADIKRLVNGLDDAGRRKVQGALLTRAWEKAGGADGVSVERFLNNLKSLSGQIGVAFKGQDRETIEGVRRLLEATRRASASAVKDVPTGVQNAPTILGFGAASLAGPVGGAATLGVGGLVARLYESPAMRNLLVGLSKTKAGSQAERTLLNHIIKSASPIVNNWQDDLARVANDNVGAAAVAEEPTE